MRGRAHTESNGHIFRERIVAGDHIGVEEPGCALAAAFPPAAAYLLFPRPQPTTLVASSSFSPCREPRPWSLATRRGRAGGARRQGRRPGGVLCNTEL